MNQFRVLCIGLMCSTLCVVSSAQTQDDEQALKSYLENNASPAVNTGIELYDIFGDHEELLINLGNAYFASEDLGNARWCYERAFFFNPNNDLALNNIDVIREELLEIEEEPFPIHVFKQNLFFLLPGNAWSVLSIVFGFLGLVLFYKRRGGTQIKRWPFVVNYTALLLCILIAFGKAIHLSDSGRYIVIVSNTTINESPEERSAIVSSVTSGNLLFRKDEVSDWFHVEMTNGTQGWIQKDKLKGVMERE